MQGCLEDLERTAENRFCPASKVSMSVFGGRVPLSQSDISVAQNKYTRANAIDWDKRFTFLSHIFFLPSPIHLKRFECERRARLESCMAKN
uniref:Uncharacterized protein n=1 Tax=Ixodes ricinus TaxID=34613 RepID=A0A6B0U1C5_IXORI